MANLTPESRANMEAAHRVLLVMLDEARTDLRNRPQSQVHAQRVRDLEHVVRLVEFALHPAKGEGEQS